MFESDYIAFQATDPELSYFPIDCGNGRFELKVHTYEKLSPEAETEFNSYVRIYIPNNHIGIIRGNMDYDIKVTDRYLSGGKWHDIKFKVKSLTSETNKVYGSGGLAYLTISRCE